MKPDVAQCARGHLRFGWWSLLVFLTLGLVLEALHSLKAGFYLDADQETRRLMWTLAHAHGALLALINLGLASLLRVAPSWPARSRVLASRSLYAASILLPCGFALGGAWVNGGDPGLGVLLVPAGGLLLVLAVGLAAKATRYVGSD